MKKKLILFLLCLASSFLFAEKITFRTGDALAFSLSDFFFPVDISVTGSLCSVTGIRNVENEIWCISISACKSGTMSVPITYNYYVKIGDVIELRRISNPLSECSLKVTSIKWNEAV